MSKATKAIQIELEGDQEAFCILDGQSKICNWLYNHLLEFANDTKQQAIAAQQLEQAKVVYTERGMRDLLPSLKEDHSFLKTVYSSPLKNTALRLSSAIREHQKGKKGKRKNQIGWPRYRSWKTKWFSLLYDEPNKGYKIDGDTLTISLGVDKDKKRLSVSFRLKNAGHLKGYAIRNMRINKNYGRYYATFTVHCEIPEKKQVQSAIALDPNHKNLAYGVDHKKNAIEIENPNWLKSHDKKLDELKSRRDRCKRKSRKIAVLDSDGQPTGKEYYLASRQWEKRNKRYQRELRRCREQKKTYMYTVAHQLCRQYDYIAIGDYTPQGEGTTKPMRRAMNNRSLIAQFKDTLSWTAQKSGKIVVEYDEKGTTRTCHACEHVMQEGLNPSIRSWRCPECDIEHIRDENAAINGHKKILKNLLQIEKTQVFSVPRSGHVFVRKRCVWRVLPSGVVKLRGGKAANFSQRQEMKSKA